MTSGNRAFCVKSEADGICIKQILNSFKFLHENIDKYLYYTRECVPGLDPALTEVPTKIDLGTVLWVPSQACEALRGIIFEMPASIGSYFAAGLGTAAVAKFGYDHYLKMALKKLAKIDYAKNDMLLISMSKRYEKYKNLIAFMHTYLVTKNISAHDAWSGKDPAHKNRSYFYVAKDKAE